MTKYFKHDIVLKGQGESKNTQTKECPMSLIKKFLRNAPSEITERIEEFKDLPPEKKQFVLPLAITSALVVLFLVVLYKGS